MFRCSIADKIVFEGVETQEQVNYLKTFWPQSYAQGWYYFQSASRWKKRENLPSGN